MNNTDMSQKNIQFDLSFESDNRLAASLMQGGFSYLVELDVPSADIQRPQALHFVKEQAVEISALNWVFALSVNDRSPDHAGCFSTDFLEVLPHNSHKTLVFTLSGKAQFEDDVKTAVARIKSKGCRNVLAVTGDWAEDEAVGEAGYLDSVDIVRTVCGFGSDFNVGAVVNPFKYTVLDQYLQYVKMIRKFNEGARYFVSQSGWDMKKAQELQWFLQMREINVPVFARITFVSPENVERISDGRLGPGRFIPLPVCEVLLREARGSSEEFIDRQLRLLALQVVGYQKLGFSGVQIAGCHESRVLKTFYRHIGECEAECSDYNTWLKHWNDEFGGYNLSLNPNPFYLFSNLLTENGRDPDFMEHPMVGAVLEKPDFHDRFHAWLGKIAAKSGTPEWLRRAVCRLLNVPEEHLPMFVDTQYLDNAECPKGLFRGPCGNCQPDGACEVEAVGECFFHRVMKMAALKNRLASLESAQND